MARKHTSDESDTLLWYRLECFKRSRYFEWLRGKLHEAKKEEDASRLERVEMFREMILSAPILPIASDGLHWLTVKIGLDSPPSFVLASLERLLEAMRDDDEAWVWMQFLHRYGASVETILRREPRSPLEALVDVTDLHIHDTRHTFACRMLRAGVDIYTVSKLLRHASVVMSERYAHLSQRDLKAAVDNSTAISTAINQNA